MQLTIGKKLGIGFAAVILLMSLSAAIAYFTLANMNAGLQRMLDEAVPTVRACDKMLNALNRSTAALRGFLLLGDNSEQAKFYSEARLEAWDEIDGAKIDLEGFYKDSADKDDQANFATVQRNLELLRTTDEKVESDAEPLLLTPMPNLDPAIDLLEKESVPKSRAIREALESLRDAAIVRMGNERKNVDFASRLVRGTLIVSTLLAALIAAVIAFIISRKIAAAVQMLLARVRTVAAGELAGEALRAPSADEIGDLAAGLNQMIESLRTILTDAAATTREVATASSQITAGAQQQLAGLSQTAASLNEITATSEEFKATMQEFADRAWAVQEAAGETSKRSAEGRKLTRDSADRIEQVRANSQAAGEAVLNLSDQMQRIGEITAAVSEIAEQTKLLALNASIEAARAGEEGRGFAVVATQVRDLANQSKEAVGRIEGLISGTQKSMQEVVGKIEEGGRLSADSTALVRRVTQAFDEIAGAIDQTREAMTQINTGARQQEQGITELVASISQIDTASKESLAAAEQTQKSIVSIDRRIRTLNDAIARFKL